MKLFIEPNDVLFFRDGRPFDAGGDHVARLSFPPNPATFYGAIRAAILSQNATNFSQFGNDGHGNRKPWDRKFDAIGLDDSKRTFAVVDFGLGMQPANDAADTKIERIFPVPRDVVRVKDTEEYIVLEPEELPDNVRMNLPFKVLRTVGRKEEEVEGKFLEEIRGFMTQTGFQKYLDRKERLSRDDFLDSEKVFQREHRVGIGRTDLTRTPEIGKLYSIEFARFDERVGFVLEATGLNGFEPTFMQDRLLRLGGESRSARYETEVGWSQLAVPVIDRKFKIVLLTHAIFDQGWLPDGVDGKTLTGTIAGCSATFVAGAVGRPVGVGGWDIVESKAKPMRRAAPAGSVYYFECKDETKPSVESNGFIHIGQDTQQGLGESIIGGW